MTRPPRIVHVVTHPETARTLLRGQVRALADAGFDVTVLAGPGPDISRFIASQGVRFETVPQLTRRLEPWADARAMAQLIQLLRRLQPDIVISSTAKAGLLGTLAARACGVPVRIYLLRGLRLETAKGALRRLLLSAERLACGTATDVVTISRSLQDATCALGLSPPHKTTLLGLGSSNGVDLERFCPSTDIERRANELRSGWGVPPGAPLLGFVGRPVVDKGVAYLIRMMERLEHHPSQPWLVIVGNGFAGDDIPVALARRLSRLRRVILEPATADVVPRYMAMDLLVFPSLREGFGNALLEAAAMERAAVGFDSTGVRDAIVDGATGAVVAKHDLDALVTSVLRYTENADLRREHGRAARRWVARYFSQSLVHQNWVRFLRQCLDRQRSSHR